MFGITAVAASAATIVLAATLVVPRGDPGPGVVPGAAGGTIRVVAADDSGDFTTINEAIEAAVDGDTILVRPGDYAESVWIDKAITLQGEGRREGVVISYPEGTPPDPRMEDKLTMYIDRVDATVRGLTIRAPLEAGAVMIDGGAPTFTDVSVEAGPDAMGSFWFGGGTTATVSDSSWDGTWIVAGSSPTLEGNSVSGFGRLFGPSDAVIRGNAFLGEADIAVNLFSGLFEGNDFDGTNLTIESGTLEGGGPDDSDLTIRGNTFHDVKWDATRGMGAVVIRDPGSTVAIADNSISGSDTGIVLQSRVTATVSGNKLTGNVNAVTTASSDVVLEDNAITGNRTGLKVFGSEQPTLTGNTFCQNGANVEMMSAGQEPPGLEGNEVCADVAVIDVGG